MKKIYLFILLLFTILVFLLITEGFGFKTSTPLIGEFDYLAPIPPDNTWSQDTIDKFIDKYNSANSLPATQMINPDTFVNYKITTVALEKEAIYFNDNGKWPINKYVTDYLTNHTPKHPIFGQAIPNRPGQVYSIDTLSTMWPNRLLYQIFIATNEMQLSPIPISYQIFKGSASPPSNTPSF